VLPQYSLRRRQRTQDQATSYPSFGTAPGPCDVPLPLRALVGAYAFWWCCQEPVCLFVLCVVSPSRGLPYYSQPVVVSSSAAGTGPAPAHVGCWTGWARKPAAARQQVPACGLRPSAKKGGDTSANCPPSMTSPWPLKQLQTHGATIVSHACCSPPVKACNAPPKSSALAPTVLTHR
jgi:hypothetical protein